MTMLFDALTSLYKFPICVPQNDTERVREGTTTDHVRHDLAARPAGKFPFIVSLRKPKFILPIITSAGFSVNFPPRIFQKTIICLEHRKNG